jgi:hypothetical protein
MTNQNQAKSPKRLYDMVTGEITQKLKVLEKPQFRKPSGFSINVFDYLILENLGNFNPNHDYASNFRSAYFSRDTDCDVYLNYLRDNFDGADTPVLIKMMMGAKGATIKEVFDGLVSIASCLQIARSAVHRGQKTKAMKYIKTANYWNEQMSSFVDFKEAQKQFYAFKDYQQEHRGFTFLYDLITSDVNVLKLDPENPKVKGAYSLSTESRQALHELTKDPSVLYSVFADEVREQTNKKIQELQNRNEENSAEVKRLCDMIDNLKLGLL